MTDTKTWARVKSPWVLHFNSGACNGCDIEIVALLTPKYDVERFGIKLEPFSVQDFSQVLGKDFD